MKLKLLKLSALALGLIVSTESFAQDSLSATMTPRLFSPPSSFSTWSVGINAGVLAPTVLSGKNDFTNWKLDLGYGG